jgi:acyl dehydratase
MPEHLLQSPPSRSALMLRAAARAIPGAPRLGAAAASDDPFETTLVLAPRAADRDRLARYARVCGFDVSDALPPTYPHVLAFELQLTLLSHPAFPLPTPGLVHIANRIERRRRIGAGEPLELRVWLEPIRSHPRGVSVTIRTEARVDGGAVWMQSSTMLHRGQPDPEATAPPGPPPTGALPAGARWRLPDDLGRRYGAVSGDRNPIHLHPLTAKPFGFSRSLAHGMWTQARCLAALGPELPDAVTIDVAFRRPLLLPAVVSFAEAEADGAIAFGVRDADDATPHLDGVARQSSVGGSGSAAAS